VEQEFHCAGIVVSLRWYNCTTAPEFFWYNRVRFRQIAFCGWQTGTKNKKMCGRAQKVLKGWNACREKSVTLQFKHVCKTLNK
jgi:hypothetical protein